GGGGGGAAEGQERGGAAPATLDVLLGVTGPVAADLVVRQRDAVAGVADVQRSDLALQVGNDQQRQVVIDRTTARAAVDSKADRADPPREPSRLAILQGRQGRLSQ